MNRRVLPQFTERDVPALAARLRADVAELTRLADAADPDHEVSWLGAAQLPVAGLYSHLLNEMNIHAWDIARPGPRRADLGDLPPAYRWPGQTTLALVDGRVLLEPVDPRPDVRLRYDPGDPSPVV
ncbi:hypothetical protein ACFHW1_17990 [Micromonospora sp. LOL_014]|uniref:hypothetical protein n=1 Tax=Micromonospora sp. LOL_014 TaxID=3345415 RepID=UPI003A8B0366